MVLAHRNSQTARFLISLAVLAGLIAPAAAAGAGPAVTVKAFAGKPFGVGLITLSDPSVKLEGWSGEALEHVSAYRLVSKNRRVLYPVFEVLPRDKSEHRYWWRKINRPTTQPAELPVPHRGIAVYFLFQGTAELDLTLIDATGDKEKLYTARVTPGNTPDVHARLLTTYWWALGEFVQETVWCDAYAPVVENYVLAMLSRRLGRKMPELKSGWAGENLNDVIGLIVGAESIKLAMQRKALLRDAAAVEKLDQPLPKGLLPAAVPIPRIRGRVPIEPMAMHVPLECFYIRCGSFRNFQWARQFVDKWGTMIRDLTVSRSTDWAIAPRLEKQLILAETALARLLGPKLISDVAIVGTDAFLREGASIGIIFEARSNFALSMQFSRKRADAVKADPAVTEKTVVIAGHNVSLVSSPDNAVRSFYAVDGDYHLVATSRTLVRRFFEAGAGKDSLGKSREFRWGRHKMPLSRDDTLFVYLSDPFFRNMVSPAYRVEMTRRMRAMSKMQLVYLAQLAARGEGRKIDTIEGLIDAGLLPGGFQDEPDGSRITLANGRAADSLRGAAGTLLPTWDVEIKAVTKSEVDAYKAFCDAYRRDWEQMDPVVIGLKYVPKTAEGNERVVMDLYLTPYAQRHYSGIATELGKPAKTRIAPVDGNIAAIEIVAKPPKQPNGLAAGTGSGDVRDGDLLGHAVNKMLKRHQRAFAGLQDYEIPFEIRHGRVQPRDENMKKVKAYCGETPNMKWMKWLGGGMFSDGKPDADGYYGPDDAGSVWGRAWNNFYVLAPRKDVLEKVTPLLKIVPAARAAQVRIDVGSLSKAKFAPLLNAAAYVHVRGASAGNAMMLRSTSRLLRVAPADGLAAAERVLGAKITCPLGGTYQPETGKAGLWRSTAWRERTAGQIKSIPADFRFAPLEWFAALAIEFSIDPEARVLSTHVELDAVPQGGRTTE